MTVHISRWIVFAAFVATCAIGAGRLAIAQSPPALIPVQIGTIPAEFSAELAYGMEKGFFRKAGFDVHVVTFTNGAASAAALASGALDIGVADLLSIITAHAHGLPFVCIAPGIEYTNSAPGFAFVTKADSPIHDAKDIAGRTVGINGINNISQIPTLVWLDRNGVDAKSVKWVELPFPATAPAVLEGRLEIAMLPEPFLTQAKDDGLRTIEMRKNTIAPAFMADAWIVTRDWAAKNPGAVVKFAAVMREIAAWANANPVEAAPILARYANIPEPIVARMTRHAYMETLDPATVQPLIDASATYGVIPKAFPASDIFYSASK